MNLSRIFYVASVVMLMAVASGCVDAPGSPNGKISVACTDDGLSVNYNLQGCSYNVLDMRCGKILKTIDRGVSRVDYAMPVGKRSVCSNEYRELEYQTASDTILFRIYNDGVAWQSPSDERICLAGCSNHWLMRWSDSYEGFYNENDTLPPGTRMAFPALFEHDAGIFTLVAESEVTPDCAASSYYVTPVEGVYDIIRDGDGDKGWTTVIIGSLSDVVESTLVNDNSSPCVLTDTSWISPGVASWVYWAYNHGSKDYDIVKKYIDMAADMRLPYAVIDAEWDEMNGGYSVEDALRYARSMGVRPMIWYNSSVGWYDESAPGPKFRLNDACSREKEFEWCEKQGVAGLKIDFFCGDSRDKIQFMHDLLECAARHRLLVNLHGVTLPRGWQRTYPHLLTMEAVYGEEWYNNKDVLTSRAACHNATLPFTRNVVGSMDYTPCAFSDSQHPHITTHAHELALTVLYESGLQHLADRPESFKSQPLEVREFLSGLPAAWDDTYLLSGYPGDYVVIARVKGDKVYIAGINGTDEPREVSFGTSRIPGIGNASEICCFLDNAEDPEDPWVIAPAVQIPQTLHLQPRGGFIITAVI